MLVCRPKVKLNVQNTFTTGANTMLVPPEFFHSNLQQIYIFWQLPIFLSFLNESVYLN
jgi:hypothetical protein